jgi:histidine triad (HIT) family protein
VATIFTKIVQGEIPCYKIAETENCFSFLDINPLIPGHTLVIPKKEIDFLFDIEDELLTELTLFSKKIAAAIKNGLHCERIGVAVVGLEVPHAHIHLIPIHHVSDMDFSKPKLSLPKQEMERIQGAICGQM